MARYPGNFVDSGIITVPNRLRTGFNAPTTKLAYITPEEEGILQALQPGTPHRGPMGIPNYDSVDFDPSTGQYAVTTSQDWAPHDTGSGPAPQAWQDQQQAVQETGLSQEQIAQALAIKEAEAGKPLTSTEAQDFFQDVPPIPTGAAAETTDASSSFSLTDVLSNMNMGKYATMLGQGMFGWTNTPTIKKLQDPNYAALMLKLMGGKNKRYYDYVRKWLQDGKELGKEVYDEHDSLEDYLKAQVGRGEEVYGEGWSEGEILKQTDPETYYSDPDRVFPQTTGGLEELAALDAASNPDIAQMIFNARNELDRQTGGQGGGGGAGIPSSGGVTNLLPNLIEDNLLFPPQTGENVYGLPDAYSGFYDSEFYNPNVPSGQVIVPVTLPDGTVVNMPNSAAGSQFQQYLDSLTTTPATTTTPTPFDYSQWPQFGPAGGPVPNYVNQGLGQWPQFNYWNQIANAYPGMR